MIDSIEIYTPGHKDRYFENDMGIVNGRVLDCRLWGGSMRFPSLPQGKRIRFCDHLWTFGSSFRFWDKYTFVVEAHDSAATTARARGRGDVYHGCWCRCEGHCGRHGGIEKSLRVHGGLKRRT